MIMKTQCEEALRQFRHNDGDGLVTGYDKETVDRFMTSMRSEIEVLRAEHRKQKEVEAGLVKAIGQLNTRAESAERQVEELGSIINVDSQNKASEWLAKFGAKQQIKALKDLQETPRGYAQVLGEAPDRVYYEHEIIRRIDQLQNNR